MWDADNKTEGFVEEGGNWWSVWPGNRAGLSEGEQQCMRECILKMNV